ncbi:MAG: type II toxin-antitoxin system VapC family toxin, partial [Holophagales bacterium]|nr:type II toxin-antitoxin system VapC family toxin [Holophagales bacterium]
LVLTTICLDTSAYSYLMRGEPQVTELVDTASSVIVPVTALAELRVGFLSGRRRRENQSILEEFLGDSHVSVAETTSQVAWIFADIVVALRRRGRPLPVNDVWIAAHALAHGATLVTFDRHFEAIDLLRLARLGPV